MNAHHIRRRAHAQQAIPLAVQGTPYLTTDEAAAFLRLSPRTLEKLRYYGRGPVFRKFSRRVRYALSDLEAWSSAHTVDDMETFR